MKELFHRISTRVSIATGSPYAFIVAILIVILWASSGPAFDFSETWQLLINTGTTITTFLMVFLVQNTQNRDAKSVHLKLDELIRSSKAARDDFLNLDDLTDEELAILDAEFKALHAKLTPSKTMHTLHVRVAAAKEKRESRRPLGIIRDPIENIGASLLNVVRKSDKSDDNDT